MTLERFCVKFFVTPDSVVDEAVFIEIFHEWIRLKKLSGVLLDVADYRHVPEGPGIMLISHEINFAMDHEGGRLGLFAQRKLGASEASHPEKILALIRATVAFATLLEADPRLGGKLRFEAGTFHYMANDRLLAPNTAAAFSALQPDLEAAAKLIYPTQAVSIAKVDTEVRNRLTARVTGPSLTMASLMSEIGAVA